MTILYPAGAKRDWIERNPVDKAQYFFQLNVSPHSSTWRFDYTVPAGRKAIISGCVINLRKRTVATSEVDELVTIVKNRTTSFIYIGAIFNVINTVGQEKTMIIPLLVVLNAGEMISGATQDDNTGGAMDYFMQLSMVEFDA